MNTKKYNIVDYIRDTPALVGWCMTALIELVKHPFYSSQRYFTQDPKILKEKLKVPERKKGLGKML